MWKTDRERVKEEGRIKAMIQKDSFDSGNYIYKRIKTETGEVWIKNEHGFNQSKLFDIIKSERPNFLHN